MAHQLTGLRCPMAVVPGLGGPGGRRRSGGVVVVKAAAATAVAISNAETRERLQLMKMFEEAYERCRTDPMDGVTFSPEDFEAAFDTYDDSDTEIGTKTTGTVFLTDVFGAWIEIGGRGAGLLPLEDASLYSLRRVEEAGIFVGTKEEFFISGETEDEETLLLSLKAIQQDIAWERCRQLQAEDVTVKGKVVDENRGGLVVTVEGLPGFVPFSQLSAKAEDVAELIDKDIPLKFVEVDEEQLRLVLSNRKAMADSQAQLGIGSVVIGTVQSLKPYGAFIDIGGINGLLHVSQVSHDRVADISTVLQPGDSLKVMILSHDRERGRVSLSTKKLEPTPGDMIKNPTLVFEKAEEMAKTFRQRIAQAEAMARADMLRFQPESGLTLTPEGILDPLGSSDLPAEGLNLSDILPDDE